MEDNTAFWNPISSAIFAHFVEMKFAQERSQDEMLHQSSSVTHIRRICDGKSMKLGEAILGCVSDPRSYCRSNCRGNKVSPSQWGVI